MLSSSLRSVLHPHLHINSRHLLSSRHNIRVKSSKRSTSAAAPLIQSQTQVKSSLPPLFIWPARRRCEDDFYTFFRAILRCPTMQLSFDTCSLSASTHWIKSNHFLQQFSGQVMSLEQNLVRKEKLMQKESNWKKDLNQKCVSASWRKAGVSSLLPSTLVFPHQASNLT